MALKKKIMVGHVRGLFLIFVHLYENLQYGFSKNVTKCVYRVNLAHDHRHWKRPSRCRTLEWMNAIFSQWICVFLHRLQHSYRFSYISTNRNGRNVFKKIHIHFFINFHNFVQNVLWIFIQMCKDEEQAPDLKSSALKSAREPGVN